MVLLTSVQSSRELEEFFPSTASTSVGPGSYSSDFTWSQSEGRERLQTLEKRKPITKWHTKLVTPGPGAYDGKRASSSPPLGLSVSAFRSRGRRISPYIVPGSSEYRESTVIENPGPGTYAIARHFDGQERGDVRSGQEPIVGTSPSAPSIPRHRATENVDDSLGPGAYDREDDGPACRAKPQTDFHASRTERSLFEPTVSIDSTMSLTATPGPGTYNLRKRLNKGVSQPFKSKVPQLLDITNDVPGPGTYPHNEHGGKDTEHAFPGLRSSSSREGWYRPQTQPYTDPDHIRVPPGPGHYSQPRTDFQGGKMRRSRSECDVTKTEFFAVHTPQQQIALRDSDAAPMNAFKSTEPRRCMQPLQKSGVSPGQYRNDEAMGQSLAYNVKEKAPIGKKGIFGSTGNRFHGSCFDVKAASPSPDAYSPSRPREGVASPGVFRSGVTRLPPDYTIDNLPKPSPGDYDQSDEADYRNKFRKPRVDHVSFGAGKARSIDPLGGAAQRQQPGPGEYNPAKKERGRGSIAKTTAGRNLDPPPPGPANAMPGNLAPGHYEVKGGMMKGTFNMAVMSAARRLQGKASSLESTAPPTGGGAGGGAAATRARLARSTQL